LPAWICPDTFGSSPATGHVLARLGAQVIRLLSAWALDADHDDTRELYGQVRRASNTEPRR
jgi:hypothetical protein